MVALAASKEDVLEQLKNDIYAKSEVWDFSKVGSSLLINVLCILILNQIQIYPFKCAFRQP
jgi:hypothetical protein